jgi:alcohol dehydrogenase class IV
VARAVEALTHAVEAFWSAAVATSAATTVSVEPSRKRKRDFSTLR